jgi:Flp pilus assembly pilin Flp
MMYKALLRQTIKRLITNRDGQSMLEYALLAGFVAVALALSLTGIGTDVKTVYQDTATSLSSGGSGPAPAASPATPASDPTDGGGGTAETPKKPKKPKKSK